MSTRGPKTKGFVFILVTVLIVTFGTQSISYAQTDLPTITVSVEEPLTEENLHGGTVTLTLSGGVFIESEPNIKTALRFMFFDNHGLSIHGISVDASDLNRISNTEVTVELTAGGKLVLADYIDTARLFIFLGAQAIKDYNGPECFAVVLVTPVEESLVATTEAPLTEATLDGNVVILTLSGCTFSSWRSVTNGALTFTGIEGVFVRDRWDIDRVSDTVVTVELSFSGNIDEDATLTFTVDAQAIIGYDQALTAEVPVTAVEESLVALTEAPLTEETLHGSTITLTLTGRQFASYGDIRDAMSVSGIEGVTVDPRHFGLERVSDTVMTIRLKFFGNIDEDATLTLTVGPDAIVGGYDKSLTFEFPVTAVDESLALVASTEAPLTEANLHGSVVTLTLNGQRFVGREWDIRKAVSVSGIDGVTVISYSGGVVRVSDTVTTLALDFNGNIDINSTLTITVEADAIVGYNRRALTATLPVTAVKESLEASTEFPLTEANLDGSVITLTLTGRRFVGGNWAIANALLVSGIDGVTVNSWDVYDASETEVRVSLTFFGDMDTDATLTLTVGADAIAGYNQDTTKQFPVIAIQKSNATMSISPASVVSPAVGEQLTLNLNIAGGENIAGYQATVVYDPTALDLPKATNGDYLPENPFFLVSNYYREARITASTLGEAAHGDGTLATLTFEVEDFKASTVTLSEIYLVDADGKRWEAATVDAEVTIPPAPAEAIFGDINRDGVVNIQDLVIVNARFGESGENSADLNEDGLVDIVDLVLVAGALGAEAAAPALYPQALGLLTTRDLQGWLSQARQLTRMDPAYLRGITVLEQLLKTLTPKKTTLLPNYPNPFNPETWIPYHLSNNADVQVSIYDTKGVLVRRLDLGYQMAGYYTTRAKAAYWDGKNALGERVASGMYFYHLFAGDYSATRKMLILK